MYSMIIEGEERVCLAQNFKYFIQKVDLLIYTVMLPVILN